MKLVFYFALTKVLLETIFVLLKKMEKNMLFWNTNNQPSEKCDNLSLPSAEGTLALLLSERRQCSSLGFNATVLFLPELMIAWLSMFYRLSERNESYSQRRVPP